MHSVHFLSLTHSLTHSHLELNEWMIEMEEKCDEAVPIILEEEVYV